MLYSYRCHGLQNLLLLLLGNSTYKLRDIISNSILCPFNQHSFDIGNFIISVNKKNILFRIQTVKICLSFTITKDEVFILKVKKKSTNTDSVIQLKCTKPLQPQVLCLPGLKTQHWSTHVRLMQPYLPFLTIGSVCKPETSN